MKTLLALLVAALFVSSHAVAKEPDRPDLVGAWKTALWVSSDIALSAGQASSWCFGNFAYTFQDIGDAKGYCYPPLGKKWIVYGQSFVVGNVLATTESCELCPHKDGTPFLGLCVEVGPGVTPIGDYTRITTDSDVDDPGEAVSIFTTLEGGLVLTAGEQLGLIAGVAAIQTCMSFKGGYHTFFYLELDDPVY